MPISVADDERYVIEQMTTRGQLGVRAWFTSKASAFEAARELSMRGVDFEVYRLAQTDAEQLQQQLALSAW